MDRIEPSAARDAVTRALAAGTSPGGLPAALLHQRGTLKVYFYRPRGVDRQTPHEQDEVYVVLGGSGVFVLGGGAAAPARTAFGPGDLLFAPAGAPHRFEDFTADFETWIIMYGPEGGEGAGPPEAPVVSSPRAPS